MTPKEIKSQATQLFTAGEYFEAYNLLLQLNSETIIDGLASTQPDNALDKFLSKDKGVQDYFWQTYVSLDEPFHLLFGHDTFDRYLKIYFTRNIHCPGLLQKIAEKYPEKLILSIRETLAFLNDSHIDEIDELEFQLEVHRKHKELWLEIRKTDADLWNHFLKSWEKAQLHSIEKVLVELTMWCEKVHWDNGGTNIAFLHFIGSVYSFMVEFACRQKTNVAVVNPDSLNEHYLRLIQRKQIDETIDAFCLASFHWVQFKQNHIDLYCFNHNYDIKFSQGNYELSTDPILHYKWKLNGYRYELNQLLYFKDASEKVDTLIEGGNLNVNHGAAQNLEYKLACDNIAAKQFIDDLCIKNFKVGNKSIDVLDAIEVLNTFSMKILAENEMPKFFSFQENIFDVWGTLSNSPKSLKPFASETLKSFSGKFTIEKSATCEIILEDLISVRISSGNFNRFRNQYDVFIKPFLKFGKIFFTPTIFIGLNSWFYSLSQEALIENSRGKNKDETTAQEKYLSVTFLTRFPNTILVDEPMLRKLRKLGVGDADIIVYENNILLLIQLKRTYFRTTTSEAHTEEKYIDRKARTQVCDLENTIRQYPKTFFETLGIDHNTSDEIEIVKWYVSNSLEGIGFIEDDTFKVNYFDVLRALRYFQGWKGIGDFIAYVEKDKLLTQIAYNTPQEYKDFFAIPIPINVFELHEYTIPLASKGDPDLWNKAVVAYQNENYAEAVLYYNKYLEGYPESAEALGSLANIYGNMRENSKADNYFELALKSLPRDLFTLRNYAIFLVECGRYVEGIERLIELYEDYSLVAPLYKEIEALIAGYIHQGYISAPLLALKRRWESLK